MKKVTLFPVAALVATPAFALDLLAALDPGLPLVALVLIGCGLLAVGWFALVAHRRRRRRQLMEMRDSALW